MSTDKNNIPAMTRAAIFGIISSFCFAFYNPFAKPIFQQVENHPAGMLRMMILSESFVFIVALIYTLFFKASKKEIAQILGEKTNRKKLLILALVSVITNGALVYSLGKSDIVYLSVIQNCYPLWYFIMGALFFRPPGKNFKLNLGVILLLLIMLVTIVCSGRGDGTPTTSLNIIIFSLIPISYAFSIHYRQKHFRKYKISSFLLINVILNSPPTLLICLVVLSILPKESLQVSWFSQDTLLFLVGSVVSGIFGSYFIFRGLDGPDDATWLTTVMLFLTPFFVTVISYFMFVLFGINIPFNHNHFHLIWILAVCIAIHYIVYVRPHPKSEGN